VIRIVLVDDQPAVRQGLRMRLALEADEVIVGEAGDGAAGLELVARLRPDVVVMDIEMPAMDGMAATAALRHSAPGSAVVMLSIHDGVETRRRALRHGAAAFVSKREGSECLPVVIRQLVGRERPAC